MSKPNLATRSCVAAESAGGYPFGAHVNPPG